MSVLDQVSPLGWQTAVCLSSLLCRAFLKVKGEQSRLWKAHVQG